MSTADCSYTMAIIQSIHIRSHEIRTEPKPHTVYKIEVQGPVRSWPVWKRYSEFVDLDSELTKATGEAPPAPLPPKHAFSFSFRRTLNDEKLLEERRSGLETYLRAIVSAKDPKWRDNISFREFLNAPRAHTTAGGESATSQFTMASWLDEQADLMTMARDIRADLNKRDALSDRNDVQGAHTAGVSAKRKLSALVLRVGALAKGLADLALNGMSQGELQRRSDMVARLQDDCEKLGKMVVAARQTSRGTERVLPSAADREKLLNEAASSRKPFGRVFGQRQPPPQETAETRPLDEQGLLQLQNTQMERQDEQLAQLSAILRRQNQIGVAIGSEISQQIEMLDELSTHVDSTGAKLANARKQLGRLG
ncbi:PhoX homologous domain, present in p47phox and p40phox, partial [Rhizoctonia solani]